MTGTANQRRTKKTFFEKLSKTNRSIKDTKIEFNEMRGNHWCKKPRTVKYHIQNYVANAYKKIDQLRKFKENQKIAESCFFWVQ